MCVASSEDGSSHMVAITANFLKGEFEDGLRLFGMHKTDVFESHVSLLWFSLVVGRIARSLK